MTKATCILTAALLTALLAAAGAAPTRPRLTPLPPLGGVTVSPAPMVAPAAPGTAGPMLYSGTAAADEAGLTLSPWGGGDVEDSTTTTLDGGHSLEVTTVDEYQGGKINFSTPPPLGRLTDTTRYLQMMIQFPKEEQRRGFGGFGGRFGGRGGRGGRRGRFGAQNNSQTPPYDPNVPPVLTHLRWVLTLADGRQAEVLRPLPEGAVLGTDWVAIAVPLSALKFTGGTGTAQAALQSLLVTGDGYSQFFLGSLGLVTDTTPITADAGSEQTVFANSSVTLHATADGGASSLQYAWDLDTKGDFVDQVEGQTVAAQYAKPGDYTVTLVVSDIDGIKKPATSTVVIHVQ